MTSGPESNWWPTEGGVTGNPAPGQRRPAPAAEASRGPQSSTVTPPMSPESRAPHQHQWAPRLIFPASKHGELLRPHGCLCDNCDQTCCGRTNLFCKKTDVCSDKTGASVIFATRRVLVAGKRVVSECLTSKLSIVASRRVLFANRRRIIARMCDYSEQTGASARSRRGHCCEQTVDC